MFEKYEGNYDKETGIRKELEKIEMAYVKTKEKYKEESECEAFIDYIKTIEKIFTESKIRNWDAEKSKNELIEIEIDLLSQRSNLGKEILSSAYNFFKKAFVDIGKVIALRDSLLEKYKDDLECCELISYIAYIYINFDSVENGQISMEDLKNNLIRARMNVISCDGKPQLIVLESIYRDFKNATK